MDKCGHCIGCQVCVDVCPFKAIDFSQSIWGEGRAVVDATKCKDCGLCERICPANNILFNEPATTVHSVISKKNRRTGSSGGVFFELASRCISQGGVVYGAAFDVDLKLVHKRANTCEDLIKLCRSKYLHSDMTGVYSEISELLKAKRNVMFVGTPCQVSAIKNTFLQKYRDQLFLVDFLCHGTGTQKVFDACIKEEEKKRNGSIKDFSFRAKVRKAAHSGFIYTLKQGNREKKISGYSFEFPYYYSYLKYRIFNEYCYECKYATNGRVGDITIGDFWGIHKYNKTLDEKKGVSMISVNTEVGRKHFEEIRGECIVYDYPIEYATAGNQAFRENLSEAYRNAKHALEKTLLENGEQALVKKLCCPNVKKEIIYAKTPDFIKKVWNRVRGRV